MTSAAATSHQIYTACNLLCSARLLLGPKATPNDYVYLGCVADKGDYIPPEWMEGYKVGNPGLPPLLLKSSNAYMTPTTCASASKRAGKRFFGLQRDSCRAGASLISALRNSARPGVCTTLCAPDYICRGGGKDPLSTSLYVFKTGKGKF